MNSYEKDLFGNPLRRYGKYFVFHDESESLPDRRWLLIGLSFVENKNIDLASSVLRSAREREGYFGEIHFSKMPGSFDGEFGAKARVAKSWMQAFQDCFAGILYFSCLAIDRQSPKYEHKRFKKDFHAYNWFTAMALKAGIAWHIVPKKLDRVTIKFVSDNKDRSTRPDNGMFDNFESYIPYRAKLDSFLSHNRQYPIVDCCPLELKDSASDDLLQFTDLLLGAVQMAITGKANRKVKKTLGEYVVRWCRDINQTKWKRKDDNFYRQFNLWGFPGENNGMPYNNVPLKLGIDDGQLTFF